MGRLRREIRDAYCRCSPSARSALWNDSRAGPALRAALGERTCKRLVPNVVSSLDLSALTESRAGFDVVTAHSPGGRVLVETLRTEGFECSSWTGDWTVDAPPHTSHLTQCGSPPKSQSAATVADSNTPRTMKELFAIARAGGCPKSILSQFGTNECVSECLGMCEQRWAKLCSVMGWTEIRVVEALEASVRACSEHTLEGDEMERVITSVLVRGWKAQEMCDRLMHHQNE